MEHSEKMPTLRISELSRRTDVPVPTIRGWERRHAFPVPVRTASRYRLYSEADVRGVMQLRELIDSGMALSQAVSVMKMQRDEPSVVDAAAGLRESAGESGTVSQHLAEDLCSALLAFDSTSAHEVLDRAFGALGVRIALSDVVMSAVRAIGQQWQDGTATIAQEHFASGLVRGRLWSLVRGWDQGEGRGIVLAVTGGDQHDLPLLVLGLLLRERGWRITWIGADTPASVLLGVAQRVRPAAVLISMTARRPRASDVEELRKLSGAGIPLVVVGPLANALLADRIGARHVAGGPEEVALELEQM